MATYNAFPEANINDVGSVSSTHDCFGHMLSSSSHTLVGEQINSVTFKMHLAVATSSTDIVYCRLYHKDGTLVHTFGSITLGNIATTATKYTFSTALPSSINLGADHVFVIESTDYDNIKIAQRDEDVSPNGHRARGVSGSDFDLDTGKDVWISVDYGIVNQTIEIGYDGTPINPQQTIEIGYDDPNQTIEIGYDDGTAWKWWIGMRGKRRYGNKVIRRISL